MGEGLPGYLHVLTSFIPIIWLLFSLGYLKMPPYKACLIGLALSLIVAVQFWDMAYLAAGKAVLEGTLFALLPIIWVILAAFFTYNISLHTKATEEIKKFMSGLSNDRRIQALLIAWGFGSFLEATAGFGTAVAVPAALLIALGFDAFLAAVVCLLANTVAVAFGVVGIPITTLAQITGLSVTLISVDVLLQLTFFVIVIPVLIVITVTKSFKGLQGIWIPTLAAGAAFGLAQFAVAKYVGPELPAIIGSICAFAGTILSVKIFPPAKEWRFPHETKTTLSDSAAPCASVKVKSQLIAWTPYILLLILVLATSKLFPIVNNTLGQIKSSVLIYDGADGKPLSFQWLLTPGTLVMVCAVAGGLIQGAGAKELGKIFAATVLQLRKTAVTIIAIVSMAKVMGYGGLVGAIAVSLASAAGIYYPFFAPFVGALGTFLTGSDTSANILFGNLQKQIAVQLGISPVWLAAANTSGACIGKLISPQSIAIAAIAAGLAGREGELLTLTFKYATGFLIVLGFITYFLC